MGFSWDNTSEECYSKLSRVLSKQGKTIEGIRATMARILETNLTTGEGSAWKDKDILKQRLNLMIDLLEDKFQYMEKKLES
jgi:hypothetical protein